MPNYRGFTFECTVMATDHFTAFSGREYIGRELTLTGAASIRGALREMRERFGWSRIAPARARVGVSRAGNEGLVFGPWIPASQFARTNVYDAAQAASHSLPKLNHGFGTGWEDWQFACLSFD